MMSTALLPQGVSAKKHLKYNADFLGPYTDNGFSTINFKMCLYSLCWFKHDFCD